MQKIELTEEIINRLKEAVGNQPLYSKELFGQKFVFTIITRQAYLQIMQWVEQNPKLRISDIEDKLVSEGLLWPEISPQEWSVLPAGLIPTLSSLIQEKSYLDIVGNGLVDTTVETLSEIKQGERPTEEEKEALKASIPHSLRLIGAGGKFFVIRPMLRIEYNTLQRLDEKEDGEVEGCKKCVVWPKNIEWEFLGAGIPTILAREIMTLSGFSNPGVVETL